MYRAGETIKREYTRRCDIHDVILVWERTTLFYLITKANLAKLVPDAWPSNKIAVESNHQLRFIEPKIKLFKKKCSLY